MSRTQFEDSAFRPDFYLNSNEQDLLLAALQSSNPTNQSFSTTPKQNGNNPNHRAMTDPTRANSNGESIYASPTQKTPGSASLTNTGIDNSPYLDYDLDDTNFAWDMGGDLIGPLPGHSPDEDDADGDVDADADKESGDKRKNSLDGEDEDGGGKRREGDDRQGKKPGRKPLTSEPTTKRKAQNRAAQRAFRERKEKHLKDLEVKVEDLEKASESANHENGVLRAQVERLQTELKEYRKRLSLGNNVPRISPQSSYSGMPYGSVADWDPNDNFSFEFPKFGKGSDKPANANVGGIKSQPIRSNSYSPRTSAGQQTTQIPQTNTALSGSTINGLSDLFSPDVLANANRSNSTDNTKYVGNNQQSGICSGTKPPMRHMSTTGNKSVVDSNSTSPASSNALNGSTSSCVTTPDWTAQSPEQRKFSEPNLHSFTDDGTLTGTLTGAVGSQEAFCQDFQTACGNKTNPIPPLLTSYSSSHISSNNTSQGSQPKTPTSAVATQDAFAGFDWLANQNGGVFDPILFGDYRDPQESIMNNDFGGFFADALALPDVPVTKGGNQASVDPFGTALPPKKNLVQSIEEGQSEREPEIVPADKPKQFLTCNLLWDRVQRSAKVQSGEADMDDLCSQLKAKAKCSGNGAVIDQADVEAILGPPPDEMDFMKMFR